MTRFYVLEGNRPVPVETIERWSSWFFHAEREVARTTLADGTCVSTEFVGVDPRDPSDRRARPLLFETRTFAPGHSFDPGRRYASWPQARAGHRDAVRRLARRSA